jgi:hypothetical protein
MKQVVSLAKGKHGTEHCVAHAEDLALARAGLLQAARLSSNRAMDLALQEGQRETAASYRAARAVWGAVYGNADEEKRSATEALELSKGREAQYAAGLAPAFSGNLLDQRRSPAIWKSDSRKMLLPNSPYAPHSVTGKASEIVRSHGFTR